MDGVSTGVSPAYFLSRFGEAFTPQDVCAALPDVAALGFTAFQAEIFAVATLAPWLDGGAEAVKKSARENGLAISVLVGHFALTDPTPEHLEALFRIAALLGEGQLVSLPLGPWQGSRSGPALDEFKRSMASLAALGAKYGSPVALEIQPGAFIDGPEQAAALLDEFPLGFNFDTGHSFASGHDPCRYPPLLGKRILATHLCDNDGRENLSLRPGRGGIDFPSLIRGLVAVGYAGSYDLEIFCPRDEVESEYQKGLRSLREWLYGPPEEQI